MNISSVTDDFLRKTGMHPDCAETGRIKEAFVEEMKNGLDGRSSSLQMIPTYLSSGGQPVEGETAVAVDIGGTNLRVAMTRMHGGQLSVSEPSVLPVPGLTTEITRDEFFREIAGKLRPVIHQSNRVGVCFSHAAEILPNRDGRLVSFSKEIKVKDAAGMEICKELADKLREADVREEKHFVLLNDTAAVLFGCTHKNRCADIGLVLGTGMNIGYVERASRIGKLRNSYSGETMVINTEAGCFDKLPFGALDRVLDSKTDNPGDHLLEKMTSGAYLGALIGLTVRAAGEHGLLSESSGEAFERLGAAPLPEVSDFLADGSGPLAALCATEEDREVLYTVIDRLVERGAKLIASAILAIMEETDMGRSPAAPAVIAAEGSTFYKLYSFKDRFIKYLSDNGLPVRHVNIVTADNATLIGTGYATLLNT